MCSVYGFGFFGLFRSPFFRSWLGEGGAGCGRSEVNINQSNILVPRLVCRAFMRAWKHFLLENRSGCMAMCGPCRWLQDIVRISKIELVSWGGILLPLQCSIQVTPWSGSSLYSVALCLPVCHTLSDSRNEVSEYVPQTGCRNVVPSCTLQS